MDTVTMYELDNVSSDSSYKNQFILESFLHDLYPVHMDWGNTDMKFLVLIESEKHIIGMSAFVPKKVKVHLRAMAVTKNWQRKGLGTEMLKRIAVTYPHKEITLSVPFEQYAVLEFYLNKGYAALKNVDMKNGLFVLSLINLKLLGEVSLPP